MVRASQSTSKSVRRFDATSARALVAIAAVCVILRIWYAGNLYQDDGLWFTAAEEILRGKALYREVFFDKPPLLPLVYAALFKIFGAHILTIRLFTTAWSIGTSCLLYLFGKRFYDRRTGLVAAAMFSVFSTTYISGDMQSLNTEFLMAPFYIAGAFMFMRSAAGFIRPGDAKQRMGALAFAGGAFTGLAFQTNPKGALNLIFFALILLAAWRRRARAIEEANPPRSFKHIAGAMKLVALSVAGLVTGSAPFMIYVASTHSLSRYQLYVWEWGLRYSQYYPLSRAVRIFWRYGTEYFLINNTLLVLLVVVAAMTIRRALRPVQPRPTPSQEASDPPQAASQSLFESDSSLLIWFAVSFLGVAAGGRFFAHYYFQLLPSLCLIGARGLTVAALWLKTRNRTLRLAVVALAVIGFLYTLARTHRDTATLAIGLMSGSASQLNREARIIAATVRGSPDRANLVDRSGPEAGYAGILPAAWEPEKNLRQGGPRTRPADGPDDFLFIWGNLPEVYYWSGLLPASRYLSSQPLTGVPADVWYGSEVYRSIMDADAAAAARAELVADLLTTQPRYIVDELGLREPKLSMQSFPELGEVLKHYERDSVDGFPVYVRKR